MIDKIQTGRGETLAENNNNNYNKSSSTNN
jgi:hypothetical protein